jgi:hypothetical protein
VELLKSKTWHAKNKNESTRACNQLFHRTNGFQGNRKAGNPNLFGQHKGGTMAKMPRASICRPK